MLFVVLERLLLGLNCEAINKLVRMSDALEAIAAAVRGTTFACPVPMDALLPIVLP